MINLLPVSLSGKDVSQIYSRTEVQANMGKKESGCGIEPLQ